MAMTYNELLEYNKDRWLNQISVIVPDVFEAVKAWVEYANVGPFTIVEYSSNTATTFKFRGQEVTGPFKLYVAMAYVKDRFEVEIIQPVEGPNAYIDYLNATGGGIHHFKFTYQTDEEMEAAAKVFKDKGFEYIQEGTLGDNKHIYVDTVSKLFTMVEIGNNESGGIDPAKLVNRVWRYPPKPKD